MYCSGFNSAFVEERPDSVPSHSSRAVSSVPRGHHTCRLLHEQITHRDMPRSSGEHRDHGVGKCGKGGIRGGPRRGRGGSEVDGGEEEGIGGRWRRGNEGSGGWSGERERGGVEECTGCSGGGEDKTRACTRKGKERSRLDEKRGQMGSGE